MELKNMNITIGELLKNPRAKNYLAGEFPSLINSPVVRLYENMPLREVLKFAKGNISDSKLKKIIAELESL